MFFSFPSSWYRTLLIHVCCNTPLFCCRDFPLWWITFASQLETWLNRNRYLIVAAFQGISAKKRGQQKRPTIKGVKNLCKNCHFFVKIEKPIQNNNNTRSSKKWKEETRKRTPPTTIEIWLILPVVICLFQGLSHACLRITALQESAHGSLHQT